MEASLRLLEVVPLDTADFRRALTLDIPDYEDGLQAVAAMRVDAAYIVTRDARHFRRAPVPARSAGEVLALL